MRLLYGNFLFLFQMYIKYTNIQFFKLFYNKIIINTTF